MSGSQSRFLDIIIGGIIHGSGFGVITFDNFIGSVVRDFGAFGVITFDNLIGAVVRDFGAFDIRLGRIGLRFLFGVGNILYVFFGVFFWRVFGGCLRFFVIEISAARFVAADDFLRDHANRAIIIVVIVQSIQIGEQRIAEP